MKNTFKYLAFFSVLFLFSCEKEIEIELPETPPKLVVEGKIETGQFPIILLSKSTGYFDPTDAVSIANSYVKDATITISNGTTTETMLKICSSTLTPAQKEALSNQLGIPRQLLDANDICGFTSLTMPGEAGKSYTITIDWEGEQYVSTTEVPNSIPLDSTWFKIQGDRDSLGFLWAELDEPATLGDRYRWFAKRINSYKHGVLTGQQKDNGFLAPFGSVFEDKFINGIKFEFGYQRASETQKEDDLAPERNFFKVGDTVVIKFCTIDEGVFQFVDKSDRQVQSNGSPFAAPSNVPSNISNGGLGIWAGYGTYFDTVVCSK